METTPEPSEAHGYGTPLALSALIFGIYLVISTCSSMWDRDEARFARATAEMVSSSPSNYLYATFNGKLRPDKPILIYWLMSVPVRMFSGDWAYRLCAVAGTALACFFTYLIGRWLFTHRAGLWGMMLLATTPLVAATGAVATSDAVLLAFITGSFAVFAHGLKFRFGIVHLITLSLLFAGGMLDKGPVALIPIVPFILTRVFLRKEKPGALAGSLLLCIPVLVACGLFAAWFIPANNATHGELYEQSFKHHVLERSLKPLEGHGGYSLFYLAMYPLVILAAFFPWTLYLPGAFVQLSRNDSGGRRGKVFLLAWMLSFLVIMIAISTKLPHYILPIWPALALAVGAFLDAAGREEPRSYGGFWTFLGGLLFMLVLVVFAGAMGYGPEYAAQLAAEKPLHEEIYWNSFAGDSRTIRMLLAAPVLIVSLTLIFRHQVASFASNARILLVGCLLFLVGAGLFLAPEFETIKISKRLAQLINERSDENAPVTVCGYDEASLIYYLGKRQVLNIIPENTSAKAASGKPYPEIRAEAVVDWANTRGKKAVLAIPRAAYEQIKADKTLPDLYHMGDITGFNYSKGHWVEIMVFRRDE